MMRRFFAFLLVTPFLASCSDAVTPVAPSAAKFTVEESPLGAWDSPFGESTGADWEYSPGEAPTDEVTLQSAPSTGAVMTLGNPDIGSPFPPGHDASFHANDKVFPGTVVVDVNQPVTFHVNPGHRVAIYKPGTRPEDIVVGPGPFVLDGTNRLALQAAPVPVISIAIHKPGTYLVICAVTAHFVNANMYGWIHVR
jgi:hypothetical protein